jgi:hypothetical protein
MLDDSMVVDIARAPQQQQWHRTDCLHATTHIRGYCALLQLLHGCVEGVCGGLRLAAKAALPCRFCINREDVAILADTVGASA